jgi:hypothetical protein
MSLVNLFSGRYLFRDGGSRLRAQVAYFVGDALNGWMMQSCKFIICARRKNRKNQQRIGTCAILFM